jgi:limonene-1,2-epoxide hydrolase
MGLVAANSPRESAYAKGRSLTNAEQANIRMMKGFLASWTVPAPDVDKIIATYFAPNASVRWTDDSPPAVGLAAAAAAAKAGMPPGAAVHIDIHDMWACGPVIATSRLDTIKAPGKPDMVFQTAGIAVVRSGKFVEYCDYVIK